MNAHQAVTAPRTAAKTPTGYFFAMVFTVARIIIPIAPIFARYSCGRASRLRVYFERFFVTDDGLISYGPDLLGMYRRGAGYVDRILKDEKSTDLAVQASTKYELVINLKTAKTLGLTMPPSVLARADELIE
jgi:hypothetical protein